MNTSTTPSESSTAPLFLYSGGNGREVFLGRPGERSAHSFDEGMVLEGKALSLAPDGRVVVRPFPVEIVIREEDHSWLQEITSPALREEAQSLLNYSATHVERASVPNLFQWFRDPVDTIVPRRASAESRRFGPASAPEEPFRPLFEGFLETVEEFRRALFTNRFVESARELDHVIELEGDLVIEIGKIANQVAVKLNRLVAREPELLNHLAAERELAPAHGGGSMGGWPVAHQRLQLSRIWARREGKSELVREIGTIVKDAYFALNEVLLDHGQALDTLMTEAFGQYGIQKEGPLGTSQGVVSPR